MKALTKMKVETEKIRHDFPILQNKVGGKQLFYFDNAATSQKPRQVLTAIQEYYENQNSNIHRSVHTLAQEATRLYEEAHLTTARFINATFEELIFTKNATEAINLLSYSLQDQIKKGDEILVTEMDHHSNFVPWQQLSKRTGAVFKVVGITDDGFIDENDLNDKLTKKTKVIALPYVSNVLGTINDVKKVAKIAHQHDALCIVDAAQAVPHMKVDVKDLDADFLVFTGHKMLGPMGIGALYGKQDLLASMHPFLFGGEMIADVSSEQSTWNTLPWKFEAGTGNVAGAIGLRAAISYLDSIGMEKIRQHDKELVAYAFKKLHEIPEIEIYGPDATQRASLVSFNVKGKNAHDVATLLNTDGIAVRDGHHCAIPLTKRLNITSSVRASFYLYNTKEEIDTFIESLKKTIGTLQ